MARFTLVIGNKNYSSWSLRPWLAARHCGADFTEELIPLRQSDTKARILSHSPSGKVPLLKDHEVRDGVLAVWDSLAICDYLAEAFPKAHLWPLDPAARAVARSVSCEMHAGFPNLRSECPMDIIRRHPGRPRSAECEVEIARVLSLWQDCRSRFGAGGPWLFGSFSVADCMYAPVVTRFVTYEVPLDAVGAAYVQAVMQHPAMQEWCAAAALEPPLP